MEGVAEVFTPLSLARAQVHLFKISIYREVSRVFTFIIGECIAMYSSKIFLKRYCGALIRGHLRGS